MSKRLLEKQIRRVWLRCGLDGLVSSLGWSLAAAAIAAAVAVLLERCLGLTLIVPNTMIALAVVTALAALLVAILRRPRRMQIALLIDERIGLKEHYSTAVALKDDQHPFARAACTQAYETAGKVHPEKAFPIRPRRHWSITGGVWMLAFLLFWLLPTIDLFGWRDQAEQAEKKKAELKQTETQVKREVELVKTQLEKIGDGSLAAQLPEAELTAQRNDPAQAKRQAIRQLGNVGDALKKLQQGEQAVAHQTLKQMMRQLRGARNPALRELDRALARGNFTKANTLLRQVQQQLRQDKLTPEQQKALQKQLAQLAEQLNKIAADNKQLQDELKKQGLNPKLARLDAKKLAQALKKAGLNQQQIQQLLKKAAACKSGCNACRQMGQAMAACGTGGLTADDLASLGEQLGQLSSDQQKWGQIDMTLQQIDQAIAKMGCKSCSGMGCKGCIGAWKPGPVTSRGPGTGGPGQGMGPRDSSSEGAVALSKTKVESKTDAGPVIASWHFQGEQVKGESRRKVVQTVQAARETAAEAVEENRIPRKYQDSVKQYFGQLNETGD